MEDLAVGRPAGPLRGRLLHHGYDLTGAPGEHRGLPSPYLTLVVGLGTPLTVRAADGTLSRHHVVLGGLHTTPVTIVHDGRQRGVHVVLDPLSARALLGLPAAELAGTDVVDALDVLGRDGAELLDRVADAPGWAGRFAAIDDVLGRRLHRVGPAAGPPRELVRAWRRLTAPDGSTAPAAPAVAGLAAEVGWSDRHLERRFRAELGIGPRAAGRVARFDRARRLVAHRAHAGHPLDLAGVAAAGGYADQAHLTREFGAFAGAPPTRWLAEEVGNVQDAPVPDAAAWAP